MQPAPSTHIPALPGEIDSQELKGAFEKAAKEVQDADISSWSESDFEEAAELFERNPVCKEVGDSVSKNIEESLTDAKLGRCNL